VTTAPDETDFAFNIDVPVRSEWRNVNLLVTSVQNCWNAMFANVDGSQTIAMVTGELLENAIKYGSWKTGDLFRLNVSGRPGEAKVVVENPSSEPHITNLQKTLKWLRSFSSPADAYRAKLLEIASTPPNAGISQLGLARITYEATCDLEATVDGSGIVRVTANLKL
jgi:hypothetical protein